jgi:hypothetical protein
VESFGEGCSSSSSSSDIIEYQIIRVISIRETPFKNKLVEEIFSDFSDSESEESN